MENHRPRGRNLLEAFAPGHDDAVEANSVVLMCFAEPSVPYRISRLAVAGLHPQSVSHVAVKRVGASQLIDPRRGDFNGVSIVVYLDSRRPSLPVGSHRGC